ncbi:peptidoglycan-binding protein [Candidatus Kaiserbacteria bacterium]|nr:peptidoglycan-binding protein [Candidatus Kaiserbacteria bacterium]
MKMNTIRGRLTGGIIALSLVGITAPVPYAQAATNAELQAQIQSLLAQIASLQSLSTGNPSQCPMILGDLTIGKDGKDVTSLQNYLISKGYSIPAGATGYFGGQTQQALAKFQAANSISPASGHFGPITRGKIQSLCATVTTPKPTTPVVTTPEVTPPKTETKLRGEATIEQFEVKNGNDTDLEEGDVEMEVMEVSFEVNDGDLKINRIDLGFTPEATNNEQDPWDTFGNISIWDGNKSIAQIDGSKKSNWKENNPNNGDYLLRMSGLSIVIKENKKAEYVVKVSTQKSVKGTNDGEIWNIFVPDNGIRGLDADGAVVSEGDTADYVSLNLDASGSTDEIIIRRSNEDPDATTLQLKDNNRSGYMEVFAFDIDTDDSKNPIEIRQLPVQLTMSTGTVNTFVKEVRLKVGSKTYTRKTITDGLSGIVNFEFKRDEFVVKAGDRITASVEVDFKALDNDYEGATIYGKVTASDIVAEGKDRLIGGQLASAATGEIHTLNSKGSSVSSTNLSSTVTSVSGANNDYATFSITVTLSPFGQDVYIPTDLSGVSYQLVDAAGNTITSSSTAVVSSSAKESGNYFQLNEGKSETLTLDVTFMPGVPNTTARLQLLGINFSDSAQAPNQSWSAQPASSYRTPTKTIVN